MTDEYPELYVYQDEDEVAFLPDEQTLIDSGAAWKLEGAVGRACMAAIEAGEARLGHRPFRDFYGNLVPAWWMVEPGSIGSPEWAGIPRRNLTHPSEAAQAELLAEVGLPPEPTL